MAHHVRLGALTQELVTLLTTYSAENEPDKYSLHRESAFRALKAQNYLRTNQFDVQSSLDGLEEKFRVYDEDALADALHDRRKEFDNESHRWAPEILYLLLELSDQPVKNFKLNGLPLPKPATAQAEPVLRWEELIRDDPELHDQGLWENIDYAAQSSDEYYTDSEIDSAEDTLASIESSVEAEDFRRPREFATLPAAVELNRVRSAQFWIEKVEDNPVKRFEIFPQKDLPITELQAVREVLFMLRGLPTSLFRSTKQMEVNQDYKMAHASREAFHELLADLAVFGTIIELLRRFCVRMQSAILLQALQDQIAHRVGGLDTVIASLQARFAAPQADVVVSLIGLRLELESIMRPVARLATLIMKLQDESKSQPFTCLELLHDATNSAQAIGDDDVYKYMGQLFLDCFNVYLRSIRTWMEKGQVQQDDKTFFVAETNHEVGLVSIWHDRFKLRKTTLGVIRAPGFLLSSVPSIFNTGKSVVLLKELSRFAARTNQENMRLRPDRDSLAHAPRHAGKADTINLSFRTSFVPFTEMFESTFNEWVNNKRESISSTLRYQLFTECNLATSMVALENIYFMSDGPTSLQFLHPIFHALDTGKSSWNDRYTLTEIAQTTIGLLPNVNVDDIRVHAIIPAKYSTVSTASKSVKALEMLQIEYRLPWPVQIIVSKQAMTTYQGIFSFLIQIQRAKHLLNIRINNDQAASHCTSDENALFYSIRSRLLWFTNVLYDYMTTTVLQPNNLDMKAKLAEAADIDAMVEVHSSFIARIRAQGLLGTRLEPIRANIIQILDLAVCLRAKRDRHVQMAGMFRSSTMSNRSIHSGFSSTPRHLLSPRSPRHARKRMRQERDEHSDLEGGDSSDIEPEQETSDDIDDERDFIDQLRSMRREYDSTLRFVGLALRGVGRAGGDTSWDILASMLELEMRES